MLGREREKVAIEARVDIYEDKVLPFDIRFDSLDLRSRISASLGLGSDLCNDCSRTLGGYLNLQRHDERRIVCALTCHYLLIPEDWSQSLSSSNCKSSRRVPVAF